MSQADVHVLTDYHLERAGFAILKSKKTEIDNVTADVLKVSVFSAVSGN
jgi:hypothetical protein